MSKQPNNPASNEAEHEKHDQKIKSVSQQLDADWKKLRPEIDQTTQDFDNLESSIHHKANQIGNSAQAPFSHIDNIASPVDQDEVESMMSQLGKESLWDTINSAPEVPSSDPKKPKKTQKVSQPTAMSEDAEFQKLEQEAEANGVGFDSQAYQDPSWGDSDEEEIEAIYEQFVQEGKKEARNEQEQRELKAIHDMPAPPIEMPKIEGNTKRLKETPTQASVVPIVTQPVDPKPTVPSVAKSYSSPTNPAATGKQHDKQTEPQENSVLVAHKKVQKCESKVKKATNLARQAHENMRKHPGKAQKKDVFNRASRVLTTAKKELEEARKELSEAASKSQQNAPAVTTKTTTQPQQSWQRSNMVASVAAAPEVAAPRSQTPAEKSEKQKVAPTSEEVGMLAAIATSVQQLFQYLASFFSTSTPAASKSSEAAKSQEISPAKSSYLSP